MVFLFREEENTPSKLALTIRVDSELFDAAEVGYRILNINGGAPGVQVFPVTPGTYEVVTTGAGHVSQGLYYAYDNAGVEGWTPAVLQELGRYRAEWRWKELIGSSYSVVLEDFDIVAAAVGGSGPQIISVADVRAAGVPSPPTGPSDTEIQLAIVLWQSFLERACRQWFYPRELDLYVDGSDSDTMHFGVPIISVELVEINLHQEGSGAVLPTTDYRVYSDAGYPDNRANPRISLIDFRSASRDIYSSDYDSRRKFRKGRQNQHIKGMFGCVESDGSAPPLVRHALTKLVVEKLRKPIIPTTGGGGITPPLLSGIVIEEWTDDHRLKYAQAGATIAERQPGLTGITEDQEILSIIKLYRAPIGIATPNSFSV